MIICINHLTKLSKILLITLTFVIFIFLLLIFQKLFLSSPILSLSCNNHSISFFENMSIYGFFSLDFFETILIEQQAIKNFVTELTSRSIILRRSRNASFPESTGRIFLKLCVLIILSDISTCKSSSEALTHETLYAETELICFRFILWKYIFQGIATIRSINLLLG